MTELDVCSPLVVGQCREEHEAHLELLREAAEAEAAAVKGRYSPVVRTYVRVFIKNLNLEIFSFHTSINPSLCTATSVLSHSISLHLTISPSPNY